LRWSERRAFLTAWRTARHCRRSRPRPAACAPIRRGPGWALGGGRGARALAGSGYSQRDRNLVHIDRLAEVMVAALDGLDGCGDAAVAVSMMMETVASNSRICRTIRARFRWHAQVPTARWPPLRLPECAPAHRLRYASNRAARRPGTIWCGSVRRHRRSAPPVCPVAHGYGKGSSRVTLVPAPTSDSNSSYIEGLRVGANQERA